MLGCGEATGRKTTSIIVHSRRTTALGHSTGGTSSEDNLPQLPVLLLLLSGDVLVKFPPLRQESFAVFFFGVSKTNLLRSTTVFDDVEAESGESGCHLPGVNASSGFLLEAPIGGSSPFLEVFGGVL